MAWANCWSPCSFACARCWSPCSLAWASCWSACILSCANFNSPCILSMAGSGWGGADLAAFAAFSISSTAAAMASSRSRPIGKLRTPHSSILPMSGTICGVVCAASCAFLRKPPTAVRNSTAWPFCCSRSAATLESVSMSIRNDRSGSSRNSPRTSSHVGWSSISSCSSSMSGGGGAGGIPGCGGWSDASAIAWSCCFSCAFLHSFIPDILTIVSSANWRQTIEAMMLIVLTTSRSTSRFFSSKRIVI